MKALLTLILLQICFVFTATFAQTNRATITDGNGNLVGTVKTTTSYTGQTQTVLYDSNGNVLGTVTGSNCGPLIGSHFTGQYNIVSGSDVSTVVLGNGTQALDYYLSVSNNRVSTTTSNEYVSDLIDQHIKENPEYMDLSLHSIGKIQDKIRKMRRKQIPESEIIQVKIRLIEKYMVKQGEHPNDIKEAKQLALDKYRRENSL